MYISLCCLVCLAAVQLQKTVWIPLAAYMHIERDSENAKFLKDISYSNIEQIDLLLHAIQLFSKLMRFLYVFHLYFVIF